MNFEVESKIPVIQLCDYCLAILNENGTCPTEGCIHDEMEELLKDDKDTVD